MGIFKNETSSILKESTVLPKKGVEVIGNLSYRILEPASTKTLGPVLSLVAYMSHNNALTSSPHSFFIIKLKICTSRSKLLDFIQISIDPKSSAPHISQRVRFYNDPKFNLPKSEELSPLFQRCSISRSFSSAAFIRSAHGERHQSQVPGRPSYPKKEDSGRGREIWYNSYRCSAMVLVKA